ncbi:MAG: 2-polyprenyl-3-methyl-6-methoxy-1,4-benzoquinone monooxygenase [Gammaproteobacteria bacterium]|nr:2-polyprenyl-3-methyl-6-methoxy-1,4-benzoquinone monooxygenase [Gammaproteobacteria bacterium]MYF02347.1 2-polyprenyl-3-methyl-6-methoxy-1,4-benzoquinone monooxygenase [Gammaproteobacteria bacterium]MYI77458.1 2-polyprenyl-3-methyl-6-methoxy-1,4-benzoquinone monooxygenase [Gammaproteobacteria bacterium]
MPSDRRLNSTDSTRPIDRVIELIDASLRTLTGSSRHSISAQEFPEGKKLNEQDSRISASLMRVNHTGEVCAQGLYEGQVFVARDTSTRLHLRAAAAEEVEHLNWCRMRLRELSSPESMLAPIFFLASVGVGAITGAMGDEISLGFVEATEDEVRKHIDKHLAQLPEEDERSRAILDKIREDEIRHGTTALESGGVEFPRSVKQFMTLMSTVMTISTQRI